MERMMADCRRFKSDNDCSLTIIGERDDVLRAAVAHAVADHGHEDTPEFREELAGMLEPATEYSATRVSEPLPS